MNRQFPQGKINKKQKQIQLDGMFVPLRLNSIPPLTQFRYKGDYLAINEFGFRRISRIKQIEEGVIQRGRRRRWITPSEICLILHILRKPNSLIALLFIQNNS